LSSVFIFYFIGTTPTMYAGLVDDNGLQWYDGLLKFRGAGAPRWLPISPREPDTAFSFLDFRRQPE
jgi:hypothetical protein